MDEHGYLRPFVVVPSERLKGGKPRVAKPLPPKPASHDADCPCNLCHRKPINRRKPPDRKVPMGPAAPYVMARLQALAKARKRDGVIAHLYGQGIYLYEIAQAGQTRQFQADLPSTRLASPPRADAAQRHQSRTCTGHTASASRQPSP